MNLLFVSQTEFRAEKSSQNIKYSGALGDPQMCALTLKNPGTYIQAKIGITCILKLLELRANKGWSCEN